MPAAFAPDQVTVLLPVGGRATRALEVTEDAIPKHLITLGNGLPILEVVCRQLQLAGFRKFVFCTGHHQEQIAKFVQNGSWVSHEDVWHQLSTETEPLGPEGAILAAIREFGITGQAMFIAGEVMVPWRSLIAMNELHAKRAASVTMGLTSFITERTTDVGKIVVDRATGRLLHCYGRTERVSKLAPGTVALTSAGLTVASVAPYLELCDEYSRDRLDGQSHMSWRDGTLPWLLRKGRSSLYGHDLRGEVLDLGTPSNIRYGQRNWRDYVLD